MCRAGVDPKGYKLGWDLLQPACLLLPHHTYIHTASTYLESKKNEKNSDLTIVQVTCGQLIDEKNLTEGPT